MFVRVVFYPLNYLKHFNGKFFSAFPPRASLGQRDHSINQRIAPRTLAASQGASNKNNEPNPIKPPLRRS